MRTLRLIAFLLASLAAARPAAAVQGGDSITAEAADRLSISLLTIGTGDAVWEKYGHNAIWVHDPVGGSDWVFNYGVFDFDSPGYWGRFIRGDWLYQLAVNDMEQTLAQYSYLNRTVISQELDLTGAQKAELVTYLDWNYRPENREYLYDYFRDNCSTRIRDVIDRVLKGDFRAATDTVSTGTSYRWHSRRLIAGEPVVYTGLHAGLGPDADQPISAWEEMFLPEKVAERVRELRVAGADGTYRPLVRSETVLYAARGRAPDRTAPPAWVMAFLLVGVTVGGVIALLGHAASRHAAARFGFAILGTAWALVTGIGGALLIGLWAFTNHTIADANENLLQLNPLALPLVVLIPVLLYGGSWARRPARVLAAAISAVAIIGWASQVIPGIDQVNGEIIALFLPGNLALGWALWRYRRTEGTGFPRPVTTSAALRDRMAQGSR